MSATVLNDTEFSTGDLWVFGYGSLMWRPGFEFIERVPARLIGEHRALCVYSFVHRGTPEKPGLVLGLDRGGACRGIAFRVAEKHSTATIAYLREREQVTSVYREVKRSVWLENEARERVSALVYVVDRGHAQYAGRLSLTEAVRAGARLEPGASVPMFANALVLPIAPLKLWRVSMMFGPRSRSRFVESMTPSSPWTDSCEVSGALSSPFASV